MTTRMRARRADWVVQWLLVVLSTMAIVLLLQLVSSQRIVNDLQTRANDETQQRLIARGEWMMAMTEWGQLVAAKIEVINPPPPPVHVLRPLLSDEGN